MFDSTSARPLGILLAAILALWPALASGRVTPSCQPEGASAAPAFDPETGWLALPDGAGQVRLGVAPSGAVSVEVDGRAFAAEADAACYPPALAGASAASLRGVRWDSGGRLTLDGRYPRDLEIAGAGDFTLAGAAEAAGALTVRAGRLTLSGGLSASAVRLESAGFLELLPGATVEARSGADGGEVAVRARTLVNGGRLAADGRAGGRVCVEAGDVLQYGVLSAAGWGGGGGTLSVAYAGHYLETESAIADADGVAAGGRILVDGGATGATLASGRHIASGEMGGAVAFLGRDLRLVGARLAADGASRGGEVAIGGADPTAEIASALSPVPAASVHLGASTTISADARAGAGGRVYVGSQEDTDSYATLSARGVTGGRVEVSGAGRLVQAGAADAGVGGEAAIDPKNLTIDATNGAFPQFDLVGPAGGSANSPDRFGDSVVALSTGNVVVTAPGFDFGAPDTGAAFLFHGHTGALISALTGAAAFDYVGYSGVTALTGNGNYVVLSPIWSSGKGAATWGSSATGVSGLIGAINSLIGGSSDDGVGSDGVTALTNGNYVVRSSTFGGGEGAVTWGNGASGTVGTVSSANSLVGNSTTDRVGSLGAIALTNGNYVVDSPSWSGNRGAATWGSGTSGVAGKVDAANSLVGSIVGDEVGLGGATALPNGNYVVSSPSWNGRGAATWGNGSTAGPRTVGAVSASNSLVGPGFSDQISGGGVAALTNGNYVVRSPSWNGNRGAVTWGNGATGQSATGFDAVSTANSLVGSAANDYVGNGGVTALTNGNYVALSPNWNGNRGAAAWGNGTTGVTGTITFFDNGFKFRGLVGTNANDQVGSKGATALANGNYVVASPNWNGRGAATWGDGASGIRGAVSEAGSLVGGAGDAVGGAGVTALTNGNYVVGSPGWSFSRGAATWGNGASGTVGVVTATNSLVGSAISDRVGEGVTALTNGNYVVDSPFWNGGPINGTGAVTWGNGAAGTVGVVGAANSLVGATPGDLVGGSSTFLVPGGVTALPGGDFAVASPDWHNGGLAAAGAMTWGDGATGQSLTGFGPVSGQNSLVGHAMTTTLQLAIADPANGSFLARFHDEGPGRVTVGLPGPNQLTYSRGQAASPTIPPVAITRSLNGGAAVTLQASDDLTLTSPLAADNPAGNGGALTLQAGRGLLLNASISTGNGDLTLIANDRLVGGVVDAQRDPGAAVIAMAGGASLNAGTGTLTIEMRDGAGKTNAQAGAVTLGAVRAAGLSVSTPGTPVTFAGPLNGSGTVNAGTAAVSIQGTLSPGSSPGALAVTGNLAFASTATYVVELNGTAASQFDHVDVTGAVDLGGATLTVLPGFAPAGGDRFTIIGNDGADPVAGTFAGLPNGARLTAGGRAFVIRYDGGDGNDVVLVAAGAPSAVTGLASGVSGGAAALNGTVTANGLDTTVSFEYGTVSGAYASSVAAAPSPVTGTSPTAVSAALSGLTPGATYYYRVKATNAAGATFGAEQIFLAGVGVTGSEVFLPVLRR
jgi:hypothetical protein